MTDHSHRHNGPVYMFAPKQLADKLEQEAMQARLARLIDLEERIALHRRVTEVVTQ